MSTRQRTGSLVATTAALLLAVVYASCGGAQQTGVASSDGAPERAPARSGNAVPFKEATLIVETNATDGDAGLQPFLDHDPWKWVAIYGPDGSKMVEVVNRGVLAEYGLTELFSESSEPEFETFPFEEFKKIFPEGEYTFAGETIDGVPLHSSVELTHDIPAGPEIISPREDETFAGALAVEWAPVTEPVGIDIAGYQIIAVFEDEPVREFAVDLPAEARRVTIPGEFFAASGDYKVEVLAIEASGNQTLTEVAFAVD